MKDTQLKKPATIEMGQIDSLISAAGIDGTRAILEAFQRSTSDLLRLLKEGVSDGAMDDASRAAHAVKGSAANVGAQMLADTASAIEKACQAGDADNAAAMLDEAHSHFDKFCVHFEAHLAQF